MLLSYAKMFSVPSARKQPPSLLTISALSQIPWLVHGFSTRKGGFSKPYGGHSLNLGFTKQDSRAAVERNGAAFLHQIGAADGKQLWPLITLRQIHSDLIHCVSEPPREQLFGDGLITNTPGILLGIQTADCLSVVLVDTKRR